MARWTNPINLNEYGSDLTKFKRLNKNGIYRICAVKKRDKHLPINRICGKDLNGILYIGRSGDTSRRNLLKRMVEFVAKKHPGAQKIERSKKILSHYWGKKYHLEVSVRKIKGKRKEIERAEEKELIKYIKVYGELPPYNSTMPIKVKNFVVS